MLTTSKDLPLCTSSNQTSHSNALEDVVLGAFLGKDVLFEGRRQFFQIVFGETCAYFANALKFFRVFVVASQE